MTWLGSESFKRYGKFFLDIESTEEAAKTRVQQVREDKVAGREKRQVNILSDY